MLSYFFLYPDGHVGLREVTFLLSFPFTQIIVIDLAEAAAVGVGEAVGVG